MVLTFTGGQVMGGGAAGKISYPEYISLVHSRMLDSEGDTLPDTDIVTSFNTAITLNPFAGEDAFNPDIELEKAYQDLTAFRILAAAIDPVTDYNEAINAMELAVDRFLDDDYITGDIPTVTVDDSSLAADTEAFAAIQNNILENTILPPWKAGMHNINAVTSSAFVIGEAILRAMSQQDIAKYASGVRTQIVAKNAELNAGFISQRQDMITKFNIQRGEYIKGMSITVVEELLRKVDSTYQVAVTANDYAKLHIAAKFDEKDSQLNIEESDVKWELGLFRDVGAFIGAMQGGASGSGQRRPSRAASIAAGAISGAAQGAAVGGSYAWATAAIGAVIGAGTAALATS